MLQFPPKLFGVNSWIMQMIRQSIPDCWFVDRKCASLKNAVVNSRQTTDHARISWSLWPDVLQHCEHAATCPW